MKGEKSQLAARGSRTTCRMWGHPETVNETIQVPGTALVTEGPLVFWILDLSWSMCIFTTCFSLKLERVQVLYENAGNVLWSGKHPEPGLKNVNGDCCESWRWSPKGWTWGSMLFRSSLTQALPGEAAQWTGVCKSACVFSHVQVTATVKPQVQELVKEFCIWRVKALCCT